MLTIRSGFQSSLQAPSHCNASGRVSSNIKAQTFFLPHDFSKFSPSCRGDASFVDVGLLQTFKSLLHQRGSGTQFGAVNVNECSALVQGLEKNAPGSDMVAFPRGMVAFLRFGWNMGSQEWCVPGCSEILPRTTLAMPQPWGRWQCPATRHWKEPGKFSVVFRKTQGLNPHYSKGRDWIFFFQN